MKLIRPPLVFGGGGASARASITDEPVDVAHPLSKRPCSSSVAVASTLILASFDTNAQRGHCALPALRAEYGRTTWDLSTPQPIVVTFEAGQPADDSASGEIRRRRFMASIVRGDPRPEAIRRLVELGLTVKSAARPTAKAATRAAELAAKAIDKHADMSAPSAERESRKNRLLKGPSVFWDVRKGM